jgi:diacylglycerol kinase
MKKGSLFRSFYHAFAGIIRSLQVERNMFIHFTIMCLVIIFGIMLSISINEWIICTILFGAVLSLELVNTAIETTVDICSPKFSEKAKIAKDTAAGAVLISVIISIIIGLLIFLPKILPLLS